MPRKQRFKPSRKQSSNQGTVSNPQVNEREEIPRDDREIERQAPARDGEHDIEQDRT